MKLSVACIHVIVVACPHPLCCCIYTALVSLLFGTVIPISFNILMEMFLHFILKYSLHVCFLLCKPWHIKHHSYQGLVLECPGLESQLDSEFFQYLWLVKDCIYSLISSTASHTHVHTHVNIDGVNLFLQRIFSP